MISSDDLMIGVWVDYMGYSVVIREIFANDVFTIGKKENDAIDISGTKKGQNLSGIRLTEKVLEKIGFTRTENEYRMAIDSITYIVLTSFPDLSFTFHKRLVYPSGHYQDYPYEVPVAFVHEFQMRCFGILGRYIDFNL